MQTIGAYLDIVFWLAFGLAARYYGPRLIRKDGTAEQVATRAKRTRLLGTILVFGALGMLLLRLFS